MVFDLGTELMLQEEPQHLLDASGPLESVSGCALLPPAQACPAP